MKYQFHYEDESPVDFFEGTLSPVDYMQKVNADLALNFLNDFVVVCQQCGELRHLADSCVIVAPRRGGDCDYPEVIAIVLKECNNGTTRTFSKYPLPWKERFAFGNE